MHVLVDGRCIHAHQGGIGYSTLHLLRALGSSAASHQVSALVGPQYPSNVLIEGVTLVPVPGAMIDPMYEQVHLPDLLSQVQADVYLNPTFAIPAIKTVSAQVAIIHDVVFEDHPEWVDPDLRTYLLESTRFSAEFADHIVTVSTFSAHRIRDLYGVSSNRLHVIANALPEESMQIPSPDDTERVRRSHGLRRPYVLYVGSVERKKGIPELIRAFDLLVRSGFSGDLAIAGSPGAQDLPLAPLIAQIAHGDRVHILGYVPEADKRPLIHGSEVLAYPSLYEGFGLPPLEALALGRPCVVHRGTSLPEVVGDQGIIVDVTDPEAFRMALHRGITDPATRQRARTQGPAWVQTHFSWERSATAYWNLFEHAMAPS